MMRYSVCLSAAMTRDRQEDWHPPGGPPDGARPVAHRTRIGPLAVLLGSMALTLSLGAAAQEEDGADAPAEPETPAEAETPPAAESPPAAQTPPRDTAGPPAPGEGLDDIFIPSEEIAADEEVTFPVDI